MRLFDLAAMHRGNPSDLVCDTPTHKGAHASLRITIPAASSSTDPEEMPTQHRVELARRLRVDTVRCTSPAFSSPDPTQAGVSRWEARGGRGTDPETVIRDLEAENARLRAILAAMGVRLADEYRGDSRSELLPAYAE